MRFEYPENFSRFYDLIYHSLRDGVDDQFFLEEIRKTKGKILEIGTGTGRLFSRALNAGADIYGIDISRHMLEVLYGKLEKKHHHRLSRQNIIDFSFDFNFDLILAPFRVMMHVSDINEQLSAINNVYRHLNRGGKFIFDVFVPDLEKLLNGIENVTDFEVEYEPGRLLKRTVSTRPDQFNQLIHVHFRLDWDEADGRKTENWDIALRYFFRFELEHLLERSAFTNYNISGDFEGGKLAPDSKEYVVLCSK